MFMRLAFLIFVGAVACVAIVVANEGGLGPGVRLRRPTPPESGGRAGVKLRRPSR